jgi:hypothetical protein
VTTEFARHGLSADTLGEMERTILSTQSEKRRSIPRRFFHSSTGRSWGET